MPGEEEAHVVGGLDRVDLAAEPRQGIAVDAGEEPALAPLGLGLRLRLRLRLALRSRRPFPAEVEVRGRRVGRVGYPSAAATGEVAPEHEPLVLKRREGRLHRAGVDPGVGRESGRGHRPEPPEAATDELPKRVIGGGGRGGAGGGGEVEHARPDVPPARRERAPPPPRAGLLPS